MREIIPLKKDILFKTIIGSITDINLDHEYKVNDNLIEGNVTIYGNYKMTEASVLEEEFNYKLPFGVSISKNVNKDSIKIEIDDFKYDIKKDILSVEVDLLLTCDEVVIDNKKVKEETLEVEESQIDIDENINNITNIVNNENKYYTYKIYIVKDNDTVDSICMKYNINVNELKEYNDLDSIHEGDKIIIPYINE